MLKITLHIKQSAKRRSCLWLRSSHRTGADAFNQCLPLNPDPFSPEYRGEGETFGSRVSRRLKHFESPSIFSLLRWMPEAICDTLHIKQSAKRRSFLWLRSSHRTGVDASNQCPPLNHRYLLPLSTGGEGRPSIQSMFMPRAIARNQQSMEMFVNLATFGINPW